MTYAAIVVGVFIALLALKNFNYLLFHNLVEHACVIVFVSVFLLVWNARHVLENGFLVCAGIGCLPVAAIDWLHSMTYFGMPGFESYGKNLATQLWVEARFVQATSILIGVAFIHRVRRGHFLIAAWSLLGAGLVLLAFTGDFPVCFVDGKGLTVFKIAAEHFIAVEFVVAMIFLVVYGKAFDIEVRRWLLAFLIAAICSEGFFTLYTDVYGLSNFLGHLTKLASCFFLYRALVGVGLGRPYSLMFREMRLREQVLEKTLQGILPICSGCKKIRDEQGEWMPIETYIHERSDADFSHGICPDCMSRLYPEMDKRLDAGS